MLEGGEIHRRPFELERVVDVVRGCDEARQRRPLLVVGEAESHPRRERRLDGGGVAVPRLDVRLERRIELRDRRLFLGGRLDGVAEDFDGPVMAGRRGRSRRRRRSPAARPPNAPVRPPAFLAAVST